MILRYGDRIRTNGSLKGGYRLFPTNWRMLQTLEYILTCRFMAEGYGHLLMILFVKDDVQWWSTVLHVSVVSMPFETACLVCPAAGSNFPNSR